MFTVYFRFAAFMCSCTLCFNHNCCEKYDFLKNVKLFAPDVRLSKPGSDKCATFIDFMWKL